MKITMVLGFPMVSQALPADLGQLPNLVVLTQLVPGIFTGWI